MAINTPEQLLSTLTLEGVDTTLLQHQAAQLKLVLRDNQSKEHLTKTQRYALLGIQSMLTHMLGGEDIKPPVTYASRMSDEEVNQARDLLMSGLSFHAVANKLGRKPLAMQRLSLGATYADVPYKPSGFCPPNADACAGTNRFPWTEDWDGSGVPS